MDLQEAMQVTHAPSGAVELELVGIEKAFGGVRALKGVDLEVRAGEVHALLGENGAGKSTLMGVASGAVVPDAGTILIGGTELADRTPAGARSLGIAVVYQHPALADDLTVEENLLLVLPPAERPAPGRRAAWARERLEAVGAAIAPGRRVDELGAAERQLVEIAKALALRPRVLVLDEPTAALGAAEVDHLFAQVRRIREGGTAIVYISHRIPEVLEIADRLTVLRDGEGRGTAPVAGLDADDVLQLIVGRQIDAVFPDKLTTAPGDEVLQVAGLSGDAFHDVALGVRAGEVLGLAGVAGNGQHELMRALAGLEGHAGAVTIRGSAADCSTPVAARHAGVAYVPADRQREGVFGALSVAENAAAGSLDRFTRGGFVRGGAERAAVAERSSALRVKAASPQAAIGTLSGGNQQKVVFARALLSDPAVLLCDEPTQGVDVGARVEIYGLMRELAAEGRAVVVCSSDAMELEGLCDRVLIFSQGSVVAELAGEEVREERITGAAVNAAHSQRERERERRREAPAWRSGPLGKLLAGDRVGAPIVLALIVLLAIVTTVVDPAFLTAFNLGNLLTLACALVLVSLGQLTVLLTGGVDLSVGPTMGLGVVVLTHFATDDGGLAGLALGVVLVVLVGALVGVTNGGLVRLAKLPPVIATLATFIAVQGVALIINPVPDGLLGNDASQLLRTSLVTLLPVAFVVVVVIAVLAERALRRSRAGLALRAVGSDDVAAHRNGVAVGRTLVLAYVACGALAGLASVMLALQIGTGDATAGQTYTLQSVAAVVIGGASIFGGRGSYLSSLLGAVLLTEVINALPFLQLGNAWQYWIPGAVVLLAAGAYARATKPAGAAPLDATAPAV